MKAINVIVAAFFLNVASPICLEAVQPIQPGNIQGRPDIIITVNPQDISIDDQNASGRTIVISQYQVLFSNTQPTSSVLRLPSQLIAVPAAPRHFLICIKMVNGEPRLLDYRSSIIGYTSDTGRIQKPGSGEIPLLSVLRQLLLIEASPQCALDQSKAITGYFHLPKNDNLWPQLSSRLDSVKDFDLILAYLNVGFSTDESVIAKSLQHSDVILFAQDNPSPSRSAVLDGMIISSRLFANAYNANDLLEFVSLVKLKEKAYVLTELSGYLNFKNIPAVVKILKADANPIVQYSCVQCFYSIYNERNKIPTIDAFNKNPKEYVYECTKLLEKGEVGIDEKKANASFEK